MEMNELKMLLNIGEGQHLEYKRSINVNIIGENICAMLNASGGYIICGVDEAGNLFDVFTNIEISDIEKQLNQRITPRALFSLEECKIDDIRILVVEVPKGTDTPYTYKDVVYVRIGEQTKKADISIVRDMIIKRQIEVERWERRYSSATVQEDMNIEEIMITASSARESASIEFRNKKNPETILEDISLSRYGKVTNAGDVLFGNNPAIRYPQVRVRAVCFEKDKTDNNYKDIRLFEGPLFLVLESTYNFIVRNIAIKAVFNEKSLQREEKPVYPLEAIREGLVNAFAHRDYSGFSGGIFINIYPQKIEISNSGEFMEGITPESMLTGNISVLRNPDISHVLYIRAMMEKLGRGSILIRNKCAEFGLPEPKWSSEKGIGVTLTLYAPEATPEATPEVTPEVTPEATPEVRKVLGAINAEMTQKQIQEILGLKDKEHFRKHYIKPALIGEYIEMTIPEAPKSPNQKYRLSVMGEAVKRSFG